MTATVVYDWNGTLLDDVGISFDCFLITLEMLGAKPPTLEEYKNNYDIPIRRLYMASGVPEQLFLEKINGVFHTFYSHYKQRADKAVLRSGVADTLSSLHGKNVKQIIASNDIGDRIKHQITRLSINDFIHDVVAFSDMESRKVPKGELLKQYMKREKIPAHNAVMVGDVMEEIQIARELGMASIAITDGYVTESRLRAAKPDHVIHSITELEPILRERKFI